MYINLDLQSTDPIYLQLRNQIVAGIAKKELALGERLPSVRSLAADIGINLHTVNKAYKQLKQEGFILIHRQKGVVINPEGIPQADEEYKHGLSKSLNTLIAESVCRGIEKEEFLKMCSSLYKEYELSEGDHNE
ncbi:GntR family transcriptional regulator [Sediminibacillus massiliensis]|uniref:GntR family transcriptional regulator n=1 Tax=Sediminibacillus massiliensis TaxID=1926277 RepID=UPI00098844DA|nr:GntR family transcriptional regulator [Sediminibacillus massiliensis]